MPTGVEHMQYLIITFFVTILQAILEVSKLFAAGLLLVLLVGLLAIIIARSKRKKYEHVSG
jgi:hypothetical protein